MQIVRIGLDLAKYVFEIHGVDAHGKTVLRKTLRRHADAPGAWLPWTVVVSLTRLFGFAVSADHTKGKTPV
jgi:hypothetical protein